MELDIFHNIERRVVDQLITELDNLELPENWKPKDVLGFIIKRLEDKKRNG
jgi:hypothetical protein